MTQQYAPFDAGSGSAVAESTWTKMARHWLLTGVIPDELLELQVFADSSGMQVKVRTGEAWIRGHWFQSDATEILSIAAAHATLGRLDRVVCRVDWTANTIALAVLTGTASGSPSAPALTQSSSVWEISLATVTVDAAAVTIAAGKITDTRIFAVAIGAPKAEGRLDGAGGIVGHNIASLANPGSGRFTVTWRVPFSATTYRIIAVASFSGGSRNAQIVEGTQTTTGCEIATYNDSGSIADPNYVYVAAWGSWA